MGSTGELLRSLGKSDQVTECIPTYTGILWTNNKPGSSLSSKLEHGNNKQGHGVGWIGFSKSQST